MRAFASKPLCEDALRLGRTLAMLAPNEPEVHGLAALMELNASRLGARVGPSGEAILLLDQDRTRWDRLLVLRGFAALERAEALGGGDGRYTLQAAISACHARAWTAAETDWARIAGLYERLARLMPSPIVELNRAMAVAMAEGPAAGLAIVDGLAAEPSLQDYPRFSRPGPSSSRRSVGSTRRGPRSSTRRRSRATRETRCAPGCRRGQRSRVDEVGGVGPARRPASLRSRSARWARPG